MVAISHPYRFIFIKTIKTGGSSIEMFFEPLCTPPGHVVEHLTPTLVSEYGVIGRRGPSRLGVFDNAVSRRLSRYQKWYNHMTAAQVRRRLGRETFDSYLKISSIRNPYDLVISLYFQVGRGKRQALPEDPDALRDAFREFVAGRWTNQLKLLNVDGQMAVQRFVRLENVVDDLSGIASEIGADISLLKLPHVKNNTTRSRTLTDYYDRGAAERVRDHMGWVFDRFEYAPDIPGL
ncbi:hypothetical protein [Pseudodonghicola flavimaris]|uniref:Sulfotransferase family protein n=1 Tax=Pseudodonghicola flavimaris TaxID=3050036 RepID=A0ABT7F3B3_9RHOB|nr:hypothetical protein [Pseudodonghicola flavimaris]MDK3019099.1 hypothetical protein [Pseudodonghicola flavimaris]